MKINFKKAIIPIIISFSLLMGFNPALATVFHVSTTGTKTSGASTPDNWSDSNCYANIQSAIAAMSAGDEVIVNDGTYYLEDGNYINYEKGNPPNGNSASDFTVIRARNTLEVRIENRGSLVYYDCFVRTASDSQYVCVDGFVCVISDTNYPPIIFELNGSYNKVTDCIAVRKGIADNYSSAFVLNGHHNLAEDCAATGHTRYLFMTGGPSSTDRYNIFRRCVARTDYSDSNQPMAGFCFYGNDSGTNTNNMLFQNCIAVDGNQMANGNGDYSYAWGGFYFPKNAYQATLAGCIALYNDVRYGGFTPIENTGGELTMTNCVSYDNYNSSSGGDAEGINLRGSGNMYLSHLTLGGAEGIYNDNDAGSDYLNDSLFWLNNSLGMVGGFATKDHNAFNPYSQAFETNPVNAEKANYRYLTCIEDGSILDGAASDGGDIGATVLYKIGVTGTFWGDSGYNTTTTDSLWPWPNEDKIKEVFSEANAPPAGASPTVNDTMRGFCADGKTLSSYIWGYLGNYLPPLNVKALPGNQRVYLSWDANTYDSGVTGYNVYQREEGGDFTRIESGIAGTSINIEGLTNFVTYYFVITTVFDDIESGYSYEVSAVPTPLDITVPSPGFIINASSNYKKYPISGTCDVGTSIDLYEGDNLLAAIPVGSGTWDITYDFTGYTEGTLSLKAIADDETESAPVTGIFDITVPDITDIEFSSNGSGITINGSSSESGTLYINVNSNIYDEVTFNETSWSYAYTGELESGYIFQIAMADVAGNASEPYEYTYDGSSNSSSDESKGGGGCFIATAAYGSPFESHVKILREFRDSCLMQTGLGRAFVNLYYEYSPALAEVIARHDAIKIITRWGLAPVVGMAYVALYTNGTGKAVILLLIVMLVSIIWVCIKKSFRVDGSLFKVNG